MKLCYLKDKKET